MKINWRVKIIYEAHNGTKFHKTEQLN